LDIVVQERYKDQACGDDDNNEEEELEQEGGESIQSLERQTWLRWIFFLVGTLGPAIKLSAMKGLPWTKVWGMMFMCSWVVFESMVLARKKDDYTPLPQHTPLENRVQHYIETFSKIDCIVVFFGMCLHAILILFAILSAWSLRGCHYQHVYAAPVELLVPEALMPLVAASFALLALANGAIAMLMFFTPAQAVWEKGWRFCVKWSFQRENFLLFSIRLFSQCAVTFQTIIMFQTFPLSAYTVELPILALVVSVVPLMMAGTSLLCGRFPELRRKLLLSSSKWTRMGFTFCVKTTDLGNLMFFLVNLAVCLAWYSLKYDPQETVDPGWTGIFG
jgi:hypothetical protein